MSNKKENGVRQVGKSLVTERVNHENQKQIITDLPE